jgi:hypothetical protein
VATCSTRSAQKDLSGVEHRPQVTKAGTSAAIPPAAPAPDTESRAGSHDPVTSTTGRSGVDRPMASGSTSFSSPSTHTRSRPASVGSRPRPAGRVPRTLGRTSIACFDGAWSGPGSVDSHPTSNGVSRPPSPVIAQGRTWTRSNERPPAAAFPARSSPEDMGRFRWVITGSVWFRVEPSRRTPKFVVIFEIGCESTHPNAGMDQHPESMA